MLTLPTEAFCWIVANLRRYIDLPMVAFVWQGLYIICAKPLLYKNRFWTAKTPNTIHNVRNRKLQMATSSMQQWCADKSPASNWAWLANLFPSYWSMGIVSRGRPITNRNLTPNPIRSKLKRVVVGGSVGPSTVLLPLKHWSTFKVLFFFYKKNRVSSEIIRSHPLLKMCL